MTEPSIENLRRASSAVYLACEESVAADISNLLSWAAKEIQQLRVNAEYWRLAAERRDNRRELTGLDVPEGRTIDSPDAQSLRAGRSADRTALPACAPIPERGTEST